DVLRRKGVIERLGERAGVRRGLQRDDERAADGGGSGGRQVCTRAAGRNVDDGEVVQLERDIVPGLAARRPAVGVLGEAGRRCPLHGGAVVVGLGEGRDDHLVLVGGRDVRRGVGGACTAF